MSKILNIDIDFRRKSFLLQMKLSIPNGVVGVFGPSGSGKSTLLKLIAGIEIPDNGKIELNNISLFDKKEGINVAARKRRIGLVFQEGRLFPHMTVKKNLLYGFNSGSRFSFDEVVQLLEIENLLAKKPHECSGGEKQRVAIGRMLMHSPEVLLLDEPFSSLDYRLRRNIIPFLLKIRKKYKLPMIVVSHDLSDLLMLSDQLILLQNGKVEGAGSYIELLLKQTKECCLFEEHIINSIKIDVLSVKKKNDLYSCKYEHEDNLIVLDHEKDISVADVLYFNLFPEDVTLSSGYINNVSAQNQLKGKLLKIQKRNGNVLCLVDVGFQMLVKVTNEAVAKLNLEEGKPIVCMFKSSAIKNSFVFGA